MFNELKENVKNQSINRETQQRRIKIIKDQMKILELALITEKNL